MDPFSSQLAARAARAFTPDGIARILRELGKWTVNAIKSSLHGIFKSLWNAFWTGSLVATIAISVLIVVGAEFAISGLGLSAADRSSAMTTVGAVLLLAWLIRLLLYMVGGGRSRA